MRLELEELERINAAGDRYGHITPGVVAELIAEVRNLRETIRLQSNAARAGMDAAKRAATILYAEADKARAESSPDVLASERAMNAVLTEENERLRAEVFHWKANHDNQVTRARFLIERGDIPVERVRAYEEMATLRANMERYQELCAAAYQMAGVVNAPVRFMDALSDGACGEFETRGKIADLLPVLPDEAGCFLSDEGTEFMQDAERYRRLKTFAHPSYNMNATVNAGITSLSKKQLITVDAGSWEAMDAVLDGVVTVNTVNIKDQL